MCLILLALGETEKLLKLEKRHPKIQIFFLITIFDAGQVWLKNTRRAESFLSLIIITRDILWDDDWKSHFQRHRRQRYFWFHIKFVLTSTQIPPRGLQRKVSDSYYFYWFHGNWKAEFYSVQKTCGSLWFGRNTTQII